MQDTANRKRQARRVGKAASSRECVSPPNVLFSCLAPRCHVSIATNCFARLRLDAALSSPTSAQSPRLVAKPRLIAGVSSPPLPCLSTPDPPYPPYQPMPTARFALHPTKPFPPMHCTLLCFLPVT